jgi:hypothetical protein
MEVVGDASCDAALAATPESTEERSRPDPQRSKSEQHRAFAGESVLKSKDRIGDPRPQVIGK